jgi:hypothetical protein
MLCACFCVIITVTVHKFRNCFLLKQCYVLFSFFMWHNFDGIKSLLFLFSSCKCIRHKYKITFKSNFYYRAFLAVAFFSSPGMSFSTKENFMQPSKSTSRGKKCVYILMKTLNTHIYEFIRG